MKVPKWNMSKLFLEFHWSGNTQIYAFIAESYVFISWLSKQSLQSTNFSVFSWKQNRKSNTCRTHRKFQKFQKEMSWSVWSWLISRNISWKWIGISTTRPMRKIRFFFYLLESGLSKNYLDKAGNASEMWICGCRCILESSGSQNQRVQKVMSQRSAGSCTPCISANAFPA